MSPEKLKLECVSNLGLRLDTHLNSKGKLDTLVNLSRFILSPSYWTVTQVRVSFVTRKVEIRVCVQSSTLLNYLSA
ncbi:hypothetical protein ALTERO38_51785 [Alteromonas sp. 38]|nr:hypothetical protein ALTER154_80334 [Alteromonas sp. 154]VXB86865.1 hypothetical protein ALTERO38_51785 [Alteromonas sp. 38]